MKPIIPGPAPDVVVAATSDESGAMMLRYEFTPTLERIAAALERIAAALELGRPLE